MKHVSTSYVERSNPTEGYLGQEQYTSVFSKCSNIHAFQCNFFQLTIPVGGGNFFRTVVGSANVARNVYRYKNEGIYAQATYDLSDQFAITGGLRYTWDWQDVRADNVAVRPNHSDLPLVFV